MNQNQYIVVVDDDPFAVKLICTQLNKLGLTQIKAFTAPLEAIDYIEQSVDTIHLVLCDLQMPDLDGIDFIRKLGDMSYRGKLALVSGEDPRILRSAQLLAQAMRLGMLGVLNKPIQLKHLQTLLADFLGNPLPNASTSQAQANTANPAGRAYSVARIREALDNDEFENYFQPKVSMRTGFMHSVESLVRWNHPTDGVLAPALFLKTIEENGLCNDLLNCVLYGKKGVLKQLRAWHDQGFLFSAAVNLSDLNMTDSTLPESLQKQVTAYGLRPEHLVLEISENRVTKHRMPLLMNLSRLTLKGFCLSIDDFGAGQTSMADLRDLPLSELKFDRTIVYGAHRDNSQKMALRSCIAMAADLGIRTVAEGVEDIEDWHCLRDLGCDTVQGFFIARPMQAELVLPWLAGWQHKLQSATQTLLGPHQTPEIELWTQSS